MSQLSPSQINYLNIVALLAAYFLAIWMPFQLFLFSFLVLGPLHYLTEIVWLHKRDFFMMNKSSIGILMLIIIPMIVFSFYNSPGLAACINISISATVVCGLLSPFVKRIRWLIFLFITVSAAIWLMQWHLQEWYLIVFTVFLASIIHITVFTSFFMIVGAKKEKTFSSLLSLCLFVCLTFIFFIFPITSWVSPVPEVVKEVHYHFIVLNKKFSDFFGFGSIQSLHDIYASQEAIIIMQYIAFSYTYHYLNWFTKTSIIRWHDIHPVKSILVLIIYLIILVIVFYKLTLGIQVATILGIIHVILELPLNGLSFKKIIE